MKWRQVSVACLFATTTFWNLAAVAQSEDIRAQITNAEREQTTLSQQIAAKQKQIDALRARPSPEQKELADARRAVEEARASYKAVANPDNESKLKNSEFKYTLAERKYDKANGDVAALVADIDNLKSQVASKQRQVKTLQQQATEQAAAPKAPTVDVKQQQKLADERAVKQKLQDQELEKTKQQNDAAQKEIERLKALLATKESANTPAPAPKAATPVATPVAATPVAAVATAAVATPASTGGLRQLTSQSDVVAELQAISQRAGTSKSGRDTNEIGYFKLQQNGKEVSKERVALKALGNAQYRGTVKLGPGSYDVVVGITHWKADIAGAESDYVVLLDESDANKPRISFYNQALEGK